MGTLSKNYAVCVCCYNFLSLKSGILRFLNEGKGFFGKIKQRYEDFHVHECDLSGRVLRLTTVEDVTEKVEPEKGDEEVARGMQRASLHVN